jgi:hypothetical protein
MLIRILFFFLILIPLCGFSQKRYFTEKAHISFFSKGVIEDISATNTKVTSIIDLVNNEVAYLLSPKDFQFEKKLMQVHFNEKYLESEKFPRSSFQGKIIGLNMSSTEIQHIKAVGKLTIHGVTREVDIPGTVHIQGKTIALKSKFLVKLEDYNIKVPQIVWQNIAQQVEVTVNFLYNTAPVIN